MLIEPWKAYYLVADIKATALSLDDNQKSHISKLILKEFNTPTNYDIIIDIIKNTPNACYLNADQSLSLVKLVFKYTKVDFIISLRKNLANHLSPSSTCLETTIDYNSAAFLNDKQALEIIKIVFTLTEVISLIPLYTNVLDFINIPIHPRLNHKSIDMFEEELTNERVKLINSDKKPIWYWIVVVLIMISFLIPLTVVIVTLYK